MEEVISILILFLCAVITHYIVAWVGKTLHEIPIEGSEYAVFTFQDSENRNESMTINILMNIFIPNVVMVFIYAIFIKCKFEYICKHIVFFVIFYYLFRTLSILLILRRKELYSLGYEIPMASIGIGLAFLLKHYFMHEKSTLFIKPDELREELWIAILVVVYQFIKLILDNKVRQNNILTDKQIDNYITNNFKNKFEKYGDVVEITTNNHFSIILLYSIMIIEDFNHSCIKRSLEKVKLFFGKQATVGIMQVQSKTNLSDKESIRMAYDIIKREVIDDSSLLYDELQLYNIAYVYNQSEDYAKSVGYIFKRLYNFIGSSPLYTEIFALQSPSPTNDNNDELEVDTWNNGKTEEPQVSNDELCGINNMVIRGENIQSKGVIKSTLILKRCENVVIESLANFETVQGSAIKLIDCKGITIRNSEIGNCTYGIVVMNSDVTIVNCKMHNCSYGAMLLQNTIAKVNNVKICECEDTANSIVTVETSELSLKNVKLVNCSSSVGVIKTINSTIKQADIEMKNCIFKSVDMPL